LEEGGIAVWAEERRVLIVDAVNMLRAGLGENGFAILRDAACEENYVQFRKATNGLAAVEVTSHGWGGRLPPLTASEIARLRRLGFGAPDLNLGQEISLADPQVIAEVSERAFAILGSPANFTLRIEMHDLE
jgi:hypothetical protein